jgi:hypothetical protein
MSSASWQDATDAVFSPVYSEQVRLGMATRAEYTLPGKI